MDRSLTICSVSFRSGSYLKLNRQLTAALNSEAAWTWIVIENTPQGAGERIDTGEGFIVEDGIPQTFVGPASGSYHHGTALNRALPHIKTRFVLFLDPDFYIVRPDWIHEVISHMMKNDLSFFGAPWHPRWTQKYRYFPCVQCMFVDLDQVDIHDLDFTPDCAHLLREQSSSTNARGRDGVIHRAFTEIGKVIRKLQLVSFSGIGATHDTGFHIFDRYHVKKRSASECVTPVYNIKADYAGPPLPGSRLGRFLSRALPDKVSFIPTRSGYYTNVGFKAEGYPDISGHGWEEFMWKGRPFGFHMRGHVRVERQSSEKESLSQIIETFVRDTKSVVPEAETRFS